MKKDWTPPSNVRTIHSGPPVSLYTHTSDNAMISQLTVLLNSHYSHTRSGNVNVMETATIRWSILSELQTCWFPRRRQWKCCGSQHKHGLKLSWSSVFFAMNDMHTSFSIFVPFSLAVQPRHPLLLCIAKLLKLTPCQIHTRTGDFNHRLASVQLRKNCLRKLQLKWLNRR